MSSFVPEGWELFQLGEYIAIGRGYAFKSEDYRPSGIPIVRVTNIKNDGGLNFSSNVVYVDKETAEQHNNHELNPDDILIVMVGATVGKLARIPFDISRALLNQNMWRLVVKHLSMNSQKYSYYALRPVVDKFLSSQQGSARGFLTQKDFSLAEVVLPPLPEQQKIARILTSVDEVIEKTQAQIDKLKDLKTGMMQELLTKGIGHVEFKNSPVGRIPIGWEAVKYSSVLEEIDSGWSPSCIEVPPDTGEWGVLKVSSVTRGEFLEQESKTLPAQLQPRKNIRVKLGDILLTRANGVADLVGKCVMVRIEPKRKLMMSDKILRLKPKGSVDPEFLLHAFNSELNRKQIELSWGGSSGQKNISQAGIKNYKLALPSFEEQKIISESISQIEHTLLAKSKKLQSVCSLKKALMQDLLTGKVRVNTEQSNSALAVG
jgi:type I restriction enzyme S subunit